MNLYLENEMTIKNFLVSKDSTFIGYDRGAVDRFINQVRADIGDWEDYPEEVLEDFWKETRLCLV